MAAVLPPGSLLVKHPPHHYAAVPYIFNCVTLRRDQVITNRSVLMEGPSRPQRWVSSMEPQ